MTAPSLSEDERKMLMLFLGRTIHKECISADVFNPDAPPFLCDVVDLDKLDCDTCQRYQEVYDLMATYQDLGDLFSELQKRGWEHDFEDYAFPIYFEEIGI